MKNMKLYHHKTDGGAEYLTDTYIEYNYKGKKGKEGTITDKTKYVVRIDGDITKDAELNIREEEKKQGITKEYQEVYKLLDKWTKKTYKDQDEPLSDITMAIDNIYNN